MKANMGKTDQMVRYIIAIVLIALSVLLENFWLLIPAIIIGFTATISWCPLYKPFKIDTSKKDPSDKT